MTASGIAIYAGLIAVLICAALVAQKMRETRRLVRREKFLHKERINMMRDETRAAHAADRLWRHEHPKDDFERNDGDDAPSGN